MSDRNEAVEAAYHPHELLITTIAGQLTRARHVAVGALSPIPAAAALLTQMSYPDLRVSLLGSREHAAFTDGGRELFDCAAQGRIDAFFLSGVQIDGQGNINLVGTGEYPQVKRRFAGSFGSAYLYHLIPNVLLFCWNHNVKSLVKKVDFISAAGPGASDEYRPGGPIGLITDRCFFNYDSTSRGFALSHIHPGQSEARIRENTGFEYSSSAVTTTPEPDATALALLRSEVAKEMRSTYPHFVERLWGS